MLPPLVHDVLQVGQLFALLGIFYRLNVMTYQHKLMWRDFALRKGINGNGETSHQAGD